MSNLDPKRVEVVARALCEADGEDPDEIDTEGDCWWCRYIEQAEAAIRALDAHDAKRQGGGDG